MIFIVVGLILGLAVGSFAQVAIPIELGRYTGVAILAIFDSLLGALRAWSEGEYDSRIFLTGLVFNILLASLITYVGDELGLDLYLGIIVVFSIRMFQNFAKLRYRVLDRRIRQGR